MAYFLIGTAETRNQVGSRAAKGDTLEEAMAYSRYRHVRHSWLRIVDAGEIGNMIALFKDGEKLEL